MAISNEKWMDLARYSLSLYAMIHFFIALAILFLYQAGTLQIAEGKEIRLILLLSFCGMGGFFSFMTARGLVTKKIWAWVGALLIGILYLGTCCFPLGVIILHALFKNKTTFTHPREGK